MKKTILLISIIFMALTIIFSCSNNASNKSTLEKDVLIVGMELQFPPFETIDKNGDPYGISVDIAKSLGEYLGRDIKIEEIAYSGLVPALTSKKIDMIISSLSITDERREQISFSDPYASAYLSLLIYKDSLVMSPDDLNNEDVVIVVKKGTIGQILAEKKYSNAKILVFDKDAEAVLEVSQGKADVFIYDVYSVYKNSLEYPNTTRTYLLPISDEDNGSWGIGIRKNDTELKESINMFLAEYAANGNLDKIVDKHLSEVKNHFNEIGIQFFIK